MKKKIYVLLTLTIYWAAIFVSCKSEPGRDKDEMFEDEEHEKYDGPLERGQLEFEKTKDPALGIVPVDRLWNAVAYTNQLKSEISYAQTFSNSIQWTERGPIYDSIGPSNGNSRAGVNYTSGRTSAILVDASDATGNTVYCGGIAGGLWKCTNFLNVIPNWQHFDDNFDNLAITAICQDPTNADIMYFCTGEATSNGDAVYGKGVWKTTNHGLTWTNLSNTTSYIRNYKIVCDKRGYIYLATRGFGLVRSKDGGATWETITPTGLTASNPTYCTDVEISSTDKLHACFGYIGTAVNYRYTNTPDGVTSATWSSPTGLHPSTLAVTRMEIATLADTLYAITVNGAYNFDSCYKSVDGGATWALQNTVAYTTSLGSGQGWYAITLAVNPDNSAQFLVGGLDAYLSTNSGNTVTRQTYWVTSAPYVHADHHYLQWSRINGESRIIIGCDGGVFLSRDLGATYNDKNRNLSIKQFYSVAMHPTDPNYLIAGAQDNGCHQLKYPGLASSIEVTGGDGCYVYINQLNPLIQFGSYVYNQYRRSINGGSTWSSNNPSSSAGLFVNPFDYDDSKNLMYACYGSNAVLRWPNANTLTATNNFVISQFSRNGTSGSTSAFKVSPYTANRVYIGGSQGKLIRLDNADTVTTAYTANNVTDLTSASFPAGYINCVNTGTDDNNLVATFTNYGVNNVWVSTNGGTSWTAIDGDLPDMPVRWAAFYPNDNTKLLLATEAGVYVTTAINGANTAWLPCNGFPTVRTDMIRIRSSDKLIAAATHGRGVWTGMFNTALPLYNISLQGVILNDGASELTWKTQGATRNTRYQIQYSADGTNFADVAKVDATVSSYKHTPLTPAAISYYRILGTDPNSRSLYSNIVLLRSIKKGALLSLYPNPATTSANFVLSSAIASNFAWQLLTMQGQSLLSGNGTVAAGGSTNQAIQVSNLATGKYILKVTVGDQILTSPLIKK